MGPLEKRDVRLWPAQSEQERSDYCLCWCDAVLGVEIRVESGEYLPKSFGVL